ncbi:hypothetical protein Tco_0252427 [Tanacetum coccineum]
MTHDLSLGIVKFANGTDEIAYKMPYKIEQFYSLTDLEKEYTKSVYFRNEEDKRRGVKYVMNKILGFYKECLELGPEYLTGLEEGEVSDEGGVTGEGLILYQAYGKLYAMTGRKAHLLEDKQIPKFGKIFEEIHVTWAHLEKKRMRLQLYTKVNESAQWLETASQLLVTPSEHQSDNVKTFVTTSELNQVKEALEYSAKRRRQDYKETPSRSIFYIYKLIFKVLGVELLGDELHN